MPTNPGIWIVVGITLLSLLIILLVLAQFFTLWLQALLSGAKVALVEMIAMRLRKVNVRTIVLSRIRAVEANITVPMADLEAHALSGGNVPNCISALIGAKKAGLDLTWERVTNDDLNGIDVLQVVQDRYQQQSVVERLAKVLPKLEGEIARAQSDMSPSGVVTIGDFPVEAIADDSGIRSGDRVEVTGVMVSVKRAEGLG